MKVGSVSILAVCLLAALAGTTVASQVQVSIVNFRFAPDTTVVAAGDTVVWTNNSTLPHTSTSGVNGVYDSLWDSGTLSPGATFSHSFSAVGSFHYFCRFHYLSGMTGIVQVNAGGIEQEGDAPLEPSLAASPSLFRNSTTIRFTSARSEPVTITILDASGRAVNELRSASQSASHLQVVWDGRDEAGQRVQPGAYFAMPQGRGKTGVARLVVVR
jgi:plastocyanin